MRLATLVISATLWMGGTGTAMAEPELPDLTPATAEEEAAAVDWIRASGVGFDPSAYDAATLAPLAQRLGGARVIGIGEATHGSHQDQAFKAALIRQLVASNQIEVLILEANREPALAFDRYVREGIGDPAAVMQTPAFFRIWKNDEFAGLLLWLRHWNRTAERKVRIVGVDVQDGGRDAAAALALAERHDPAAAARVRADLAPLIAAMDKPRTRFVDWLIDAERAETERAATGAAALDAWFEAAPAAARADPGFAEARWAARTAHQAFMAFEFERADADKSKADAAYFARRDRYMGENALAMLEPGERGALWAHDMHVLEDLPDIAKAVGFVTVGTVLREKLGEDYATVGFTWSQGAFRATLVPEGADFTRASQRQTLEPFNLPNNRPGELGHVFDRTGHMAMWIDLARRPAEGPVARWTGRPYWRGWSGWVANPENWQVTSFESGDVPLPVSMGHDVIVWFKTISPSHLWPQPQVADQTAPGS